MLPFQLSGMPRSCFNVFAGIVVVLLALAGCKKETASGRNFKQLNFDAAGKDFRLWPNDYDTDPANLGYLLIPPEATKGSQYIEYYRFKCDTAEIKQVYIHWWYGYVHLLSSSAPLLKKKATLKIPMPIDNYSANTAYKPFKIKMSKDQNVVSVINNPVNRIPVTDFTWDNDGKFIIIYTEDLNAAYFMARPKK